MFVNTSRIIRISVIKNSFFEYLLLIDLFDKNLALFVFQCTISRCLTDSLLSIPQISWFVNTFFNFFSLFFQLRYRLSATTHLVYHKLLGLSIPFFDFFESFLIFFPSLWSPAHRPSLGDSLFILPHLSPFVNTFFTLFLPLGLLYRLFPFFRLLFQQVAHIKKPRKAFAFRRPFNRN